MFQILSNPKSRRTWTLSSTCIITSRHDHNFNVYYFLLLSARERPIWIAFHWVTRFAIREMYIAFYFHKANMPQNEGNKYCFLYHQGNRLLNRGNTYCLSSTWTTCFLTREILPSLSLGWQPFRTRKILTAFPITWLTHFYSKGNIHLSF